jgi:hypothetical protein
MAESFLREQLERIRALTERMTAVQNRVAELSDEIAHDREAMHQGPLHEVRDYRTYSSPNTDEPRQSPARGRRRRHRR